MKKATFQWATRALQALFWCLLLLGTGGELSGFAWAEEKNARLDEVLANIRANEALYEDYELVYQQQYTSGDDKYEIPGTAVSVEASHRIILQDGLIYFKYDLDGKTNDNRDWDEATVQGCDGEKTRLVEWHRWGNIHDGRVEDGRIKRPHMMLIKLGTVHTMARLSEYLDSGMEDDVTIHTSVLGEESCDGLQCVKLQCDARKEGQSTDADTPLYRAYLWLSPERNYLPVRFDFFGSYQGKFNGKTPDVVGESKNFEEIEPGVWFPMRSTVTVYDLPYLFEDHKQVVSNQREIVVEKLSLYPEYPLSLFKDIEFPPGITVYEVRNGEIVETHRTPGEYDGPPDPVMLQSGGHGLLVVVNLIAGLCIILGWLWYRRRRRTALA